VPTAERHPALNNDQVVIENGAVRRATSTSVAPGARETSHVMRPGETLYAVSTQNGLSVRDVMAWNDITDPSRIAVGQVIRLTPPTAAPAQTAAVTAPIQTAPAPQTINPAASVQAHALVQAQTRAENQPKTFHKTGPKAVKMPYSDERYAEMRAQTQRQIAAATPQKTVAPDATVPAAVPAQPVQPAQPAVADTGSWIWPTQGKVVTRFSESASLKGIDIVGGIGQPVVAASAGRVVYVGSGLRGYGKLVIIKHNDTYLTVYAHNRAIVVKQGEQVRQGQKIAEMGNTDADQVKLHFEIRKNGRPVDPLQYLPRK
jgi:lipoprotein NlpD